MRLSFVLLDISAHELPRLACEKCEANFRAVHTACEQQREPHPTTDALLEAFVHSPILTTRDVAWHATIDAGRPVPRASRIGTLGAPSCCVEVEHSLLGELLDEQPTWRLSTPRSN